MFAFDYIYTGIYGTHIYMCICISYAFIVISKTDIDIGCIDVASTMSMQIINRFQSHTIVIIYSRRHTNTSAQLVRMREFVRLKLSNQMNNIPTV